MTLRGDSYGTSDEVLAFTKHLLSGEETFNAATRPTDTEVDKFIDRASGILNVALEGVGLTTPAPSGEGVAVWVGVAVWALKIDKLPASPWQLENARTKNAASSN